MKVHRYLGLFVAAFLVLIAATGSVIAFYDELERALNPRMRVVAPQGPLISVQQALSIRARLEAEDPRSHVFSLQFPQRPDEPLFSRVMPAIDPATGLARAIDYDEVFANPYTGKRLGQRLIGAATLRPSGLPSFLYYLHYALIFPLGIGILLIGVLGLVWAVVSIAGFYLTLPPKVKRSPLGKPTRPFRKRWATSWKISQGANGNRFVLDLHRATGLWLWPLLMVFAVTGFALNLGGYWGSFVKTFAAYEHFQELPPRPPLPAPLIDPPVDWYRAADLGQRYYAQAARHEGFKLGRPAALEYRRDLGVYFFLVHTSRDLLDAQGNPTETDSPATAATMAIDARTGRMIGLQLPTGQRAGNTATSWLIALHVTAIGGRAWQIAISLFGVAVVAISCTGVLLWWRRRKARPQRARPPVAAPRHIPESTRTVT
ncbi:PepSY-associated TM helix domain-containing protein [Novosphingobium cyanobacteriorum]|uniref:PepSY-associated TM helix domain-containing protein n=1 Tax=Novosphingobium cyanobacteriorum TaxID=3024215 RepID=A0ABT6CII5_9SPHN|nr:PepSY-associated TM helix domain-containing protein [Novosphingobium cyanobacteriorum]MDF8333733.1 PepSY-associated TM helix domain-containing protein [Novosphingobium cyanobacteriorum]